MRKFLIPLVLAGLLAACGHAPTKPGSTAPSGEVAAQPAEGAVRYAVDPANSDVRFLVYKAGALASFGHVHVVEARDYEGEVYLAKDFSRSSFSLKLPVKKFEVDRRAARQEEGGDFAKQQPSAGDIQGTTTNMLGPGELDAERFPDVLIQSVRIAGAMADARVTVRVTLHGTARDLTVPVKISQEGEALTAEGAFDLNQSEFGIKPFSAAGGALQVADTIHVKFRVHAHKG